MKILRITTTLALILAFCVVMLGAYTRLTDAGLGCPDWPGCYGRLVLPAGQQDLAHAQQAYPGLPLESRKAWTEMIHRYAAGTLVLLVLSIVVNGCIQRYRGVKISLLLPVLLILLIGFQAALGMWTVTMKLLPVVVMGHLLGGMFIVACLCTFRWQLSDVKGINMVAWRPWVRLGLIILICQIALGGWVSANYAGIACIGFPRCNGQWLPSLHLNSAFHVALSTSTNYQGGVLEHASRVGIQMIHRLGAVVTAIYLLTLMGLLIFRIRVPHVRFMAGLVTALVFTQFALGMANVLYLLPLPVAVAHNGVAVLLLMALISLHHMVSTENKGVA